MRSLGLDYGDKTIGVAVSDPGGRVALGVETIRRENADALRASIRRLKALITEYEVTDIILGFPKHMNGTPSQRCEQTLLFKEKLERNFKSVPVRLWDERLSTVAVMRGRSGEFSQVDEMAAVYILQGYLDNKNRDREAIMENEFDETLEWDDDEGSAITMFDDEGNETKYNVLSTRKDGECIYLLVEEITPEQDEEAAAEVLHFKCIASEDEEMVFELVDDEHEDFDKVFALFKEDYDALDIEY